MTSINIWRMNWTITKYRIFLCFLFLSDVSDDVQPEQRYATFVHLSNLGLGMDIDSGPNFQLDTIDKTNQNLFNLGKPKFISDLLIEFPSAKASDQTFEQSEKQKLQVRVGSPKRGIAGQSQNMRSGRTSPKKSRSRRTRSNSPSRSPKSPYPNRAAKSEPGPSIRVTASASSLNSLEKGLATDREDDLMLRRATGEPSPTRRLKHHLRPEYNKEPKSAYSGSSKKGASLEGSHDFQDLHPSVDADEVTSKLMELVGSHRENKRSRSSSSKSGAGPSRTPARNGSSGSAKQSSSPLTWDMYRTPDSTDSTAATHPSTKRIRLEE